MSFIDAYKDRIDLFAQGHAEGLRDVTEHDRYLKLTNLFLVVDEHLGHIGSRGEDALWSGSSESDWQDVTDPRNKEPVGKMMVMRKFGPTGDSLTLYGEPEIGLEPPKLAEATRRYRSHAVRGILSVGIATPEGWKDHADPLNEEGDFPFLEDVVKQVVRAQTARAHAGDETLKGVKLSGTGRNITITRGFSKDVEPAVNA